MTILLQFTNNSGSKKIMKIGQHFGKVIINIIVVPFVASQCMCFWAGLWFSRVESWLWDISRLGLGVKAMNLELGLVVVISTFLVVVPSGRGPAYSGPVYAEAFLW